MNRSLLKFLFLVLLFCQPLMSFADGNGTLGTSFTMTKCGLNYTASSAVIGQRFSPPGVLQPTNMIVSLPCAAAVIEKAFLYAEGSGDGAPITATITGANGTFNDPMTLIGQAGDKCWGYTYGPGGNGSFTYRADVTNAISLTGSYTISGLPVNPGTAGPGLTDIDGITLIIIYSIPFTSWTGTIQLDDGAIERSGGIASYDMTYPAVCGPTANSRVFMAVGDLQPNVAAGTITMNGSPTPYSNTWYDYFDIASPIAAGQTTSNFTVNNSSDCYNVLLTGIYYQTTTCQFCPKPIVTVDTTKTPDHCESCDGTAGVTATSNDPCLYFKYTWSNGDTSANVTHLCAGVYTVTVDAYDAVTNLIDTSVTTTITIDAYGHLFYPDSGIAINPKCYGYCDGSITANPNGGTAPYTYLWSPGGYTTQTITDLCHGTYFVIIKDSFNCIGKDTFVLTQPAMLAGPNTGQVAYCQFDITVPLTASPSFASDSLVWYTQPTGGTGTLTAPVPSSAVPGTFIWYVSERDSTGCESVRIPTWVYIKAKPTPPAVLTSEYNYCQFDTAMQLAAVGDSLKWYTTPTGGTYTMTAPLPSTASLGVFTWYVSQTVNGCESDRVPISVGVYVKPEPPVTQDIIYCQGDTALPLTAIGTDLHWYLYPYGGSPQPVPTPITTIPDTVWWYVASNNHGCESDRTPLKVITKYRPTVHILYSNDSVCQFDTLTYAYSGNAQDSAKYYWEWPVGAHVLSGNDSTRGPIVVEFDSTGLKYVSLTVTDRGCTGPRVSVPVRVKVLPVVNIKMSARDACKDDTITVGIDYANMQIRNFWWNFDNGITPWGSSGVWGADGGGPYYITWPTMGIHTVTLHVQGVNMCYSRPDKVDTVNLHDRPEAKILPGYANNICSGDSIRLEASTNLPGYSYQWAPKQFFDDGDNTSVVNAYIEGTKYVSLTVTNEFGCKYEDSVLITTKPCCEIFLPDAFSPNGDGKNDLFRIVDQGRHPLTDFRIFNRWGEIVFDTANPTQGWDGSHEGVAQDIGVYYYIVKFKCDGKAMTKSGQVTLIR